MEARPTKTEYYLDIAEVVALRSTCLRRKYGAVIVKDDVIIATGYNGAPRGEDNCCDIGSCWREENNIPHGERYEACRSVHAEQNALLSAGREAKGATLYLFGYEAGDLKGSLKAILDPKPCDICRRLIVNAQIAQVITMKNLSQDFS